MSAQALQRPRADKVLAVGVDLQLRAAPVGQLGCSGGTARSVPEAEPALSQSEPKRK